MASSATKASPLRPSPRWRPIARSISATFSRTLGAGLEARLSRCAAAASPKRWSRPRRCSTRPPPGSSSPRSPRCSRARATPHHVARVRAHYQGEPRRVCSPRSGALRRDRHQRRGGGLHLLWRLPPGVPDAALVEALARRAAHRRLFPSPRRASTVFRASLLERRTLVLGYGALLPSRSRKASTGSPRSIDDTIDDPFDRRQRFSGPRAARARAPPAARPRRRLDLDSKFPPPAGSTPIAPARANLACERGGRDGPGQWRQMTVSQDLLISGQGP